MVMDRRARAAPRAEEERPSHGRFLRPGALARLRDSRIVARSLRSAAARLPIPSAPPSPAPEQQRQDAVPHFLVGPTRGLCGAARYPLRRRMAAARCVVFLPPPEAFLDAHAHAPAPSWGLAAAH
ncbi:hypothetical protein D1007_52008 [Hordeum vulgare]|uniref:uncharacterized protein LOC123402172 n=1 Tax=Hordeum vulgare subsp. vulgare TaxID=112509 RepID=UPI001D1A5AC0|nr:uncharacterized protein LOC123402172 [Hordeum vulgare subsp. vulgare]KAE8775451.1 hypothetical protein D1007_52008 [Hordeum vulgare]KAI4977811.1 hypothetical protein ZWY2020_014365 [Hordeum vulgare]